MSRNRPAAKLSFEIDTPENRRKGDRIILREFPRVHLTLGKDRELEVELIDVSKTGCGFRMPNSSELDWAKEGEQLTARMHFSADTYIPVKLHITNRRATVEDGKQFLHIGCSIDTSCPFYVVYDRFVVFMEFYSAHALRNVGNVGTSYL